MISGVTSGWNCVPRLGPTVYACGPAGLSAISCAPAGISKVSKCHWNHGPSGTSSGSFVRTGSQPISGSSESQQRAAEADPEDRHAGVGGAPQQIHLPRDPGDGVVERGELRAERHDHIVLPRLDVALFDVDPVEVHAGALLLQPVEDQAARRGLLVLQDEGPHAATSSSSCATRLTEAAKRSTISSSSSSVAVNDGANRLWSPA